MTEDGGRRMRLKMRCHRQWNKEEEEGDGRRQQKRRCERLKGLMCVNASNIVVN